MNYSLNQKTNKEVLFNKLKNDFIFLRQGPYQIKSTFIVSILRVNKIYPMLTKRLGLCFSQMILFNGSLSFSPNSLNNTYMSYALAKKWEQEDAPYETWMRLISTVKEINDDMHSYALQSYKSQKEIRQKYTLKLFSDCDVEGDGAVYSDFTARAIFDSTSQTPFKILDADERFPVSSPMGFHKAVIADMDTDSQSKSKLFAYQLILDDKFSLALEPTQFRNISKKYSRTLEDDLLDGCIYGADWFTIGTMKILSHNQKFTAKQKILNDFANEIKAVQEAKNEGQKGKQRLKKLKKNYILKMNQFNYNWQTLLSFISGYIEPTFNTDAMPTTNWRVIKLPLGADSSQQSYQTGPYGLPNLPKRLYMKNVAGGILFDLNNLLEVITCNKEFRYKDKIKVSLTQITNISGPPAPPNFQFVMTKDLAQQQVGMYFIKDKYLKQVTYKAKVEYFQGTNIDKQSENYIRRHQLKTTSKVRYFQGFENEFSFEILERFKKTDHMNNINGTSLNVQKFSPFITYDYRCMRFGAPIPEETLAKLNLTLEFKYDYTLGKSPMDLRGIFQYADGKSDKILEEALSSDYPFAHKYQSMEKVKKEYYQGRYEDITKIANDLKKSLQSTSQNEKGQTVLSYFWKNSKGIHFAPQFNDPNEKDSIIKKTIPLVSKGSFNVYLNQNLTRFNNPRSLRGKFKNKDISNPILNSLAIDCEVNAVITTKSGQVKTQTKDSISGVFFESNPDLGSQYPDWKNYIGPRLRLMSLLYPAMQKIVNLYQFNNIDLQAMKRAFDIEDQKHSRYMPSTRQISPFQHRMIRRWLYEPYYDNSLHTNLNFKCFEGKYSHLSFHQTKDVLRQKLKDAFSFQLFTIPLYLTAMYTTKSTQYQKVFREVLHDEMKHLFIASNLINAIREPGCNDPKNGPPYLDPQYVPSFLQGQASHPRYVYNTSTSFSSQIKKLYSFGIQPLSQDILLKMIAAEFPSETKNLRLSIDGELCFESKAKILQVQTKVIDLVNQQQANNLKFHTIGELYSEIVTLLWDLYDKERKGKKGEYVLFSGDTANQFTYPQLTHMQQIYSLRTALNQIRLIVDQGEGARIFDVKNKLKKLSHFLRFIEIYTGCQVDQQKTDKLNSIHKDDIFTIYFKQHEVLLNNKINKWTAPDQDKKVRQIVEKELPGRRTYGQSQYTSVASVEGFTNVYKKILLELHYVFNSSFANFKKYAEKEMKISSTDISTLQSEFKKFKFRRMQNAIAKMRQMSLHARYNIRQQPLPNYQLKAPLDSIEGKGNQRLSVRPDFTVHVEFPTDEE